MAIRVKQLATELGFSAEDMIDKLNEIGINVKTQAFPLKNDQVKKAREVYGKKEEKTTSAKSSKTNTKKTVKNKTIKKTTVSKEDMQAQERKAAIEAERKQREAERCSSAKKSGLLGSNVSRSQNKSKEKISDEPKKVSSQDLHKNDEQQDLDKKIKQVISHESAPQLGKLLSQIEDANQRAKIEAAIRQRKQKLAAQAKVVAKQRQVQEALKNKSAKFKNSVQDSVQKPKEDRPKKVISAHYEDKNAKEKLGSLLDQISQEQQRLKDSDKNTPSKSKTARQKSNKGKKNKYFEPDVPELESYGKSKEDKYAQMAAAAEKLQRDKVIEEARAAVAAATHDGESRRKKRKEKREAEAREKAELETIEKGIDPDLVLDDSVAEIPEGATVAEFAECLNVAPNDVIKRLFLLGQVLTLTQTMPADLVELIADDMDRKVRIVSPEEEFNEVYVDSVDDLVERPPVVTVMGHVDHGKTSLLDAIRDTAVIESESGGITQHIGASVVFKNDRQITFIDTPGHEAFTAMRARGAEITDVIVLVVAADDGVMPQTKEAINHAKAADVPVVVAINKIDKDGANIDRVKNELSNYDIISEEWGGKNMFVEISAKKRLHIDELLETILLQADVLELKANPNAKASGFVIEANLDKGRGPVATVLVNRGVLHPGDVVVAGTSYGKVRALIGPYGKHYNGVEPGEPAEVLGLDSVPVAGDDFRVFDDEREARKLVESRRLRQRIAMQNSPSHMQLDELFSRIEEGKQTDLNLIIKADVQGSIEALRDALSKIDQSEVKINIVHSAVGGITETDVTLATASDAIIIGFNVRPTGKSRQMAEKEKVDIRTYKVIYQALEDINAARVGLLSPDVVEQDSGIAEVRELFKVPKVGTIAGTYVTEGQINRDDSVRIVRDGTVVFEGKIASLRRFKDDVKTVKEGYECGIGVEGYQDIKVGDTIEGFKKVEVERTE